MKRSDILDLKFKSDDLGTEVTIRKYFHILLKTLWQEREGFDGKRPFGNSSWDADVIKCLVENKLIKGTIDEYGYLEKVDWDKANKFVSENIIDEIFNPSTKGL